MRIYYLIANIGFDTTENEAAKKLQSFANFQFCEFFGVPAGGGRNRDRGVVAVDHDALVVVVLDDDQAVRTSRPICKIFKIVQFFGGLVTSCALQN